MEYSIYEVELSFQDQILGGIPKDPSVIDSWLKGQGVDEEEARKEIEEGMEDEVDFDPEKSNWTTFKSDENGVYIEPRNIKGLLKECMDTLDINRGKGSVARKQTMQHGLFVKPEKIYLERQDTEEIIEEPDDYDERPIHIMTARGPRTALTRQDYVENARIEFRIKVAVPRNRETAHIGKTHLQDMLELGQEDGLGAARTQGYGKFVIEKFEKVE